MRLYTILKGIKRAKNVKQLNRYVYLMLQSDYRRSRVNEIMLNEVQDKQFELISNTCK